ncbi:hypothetical protein DFR70_111185 [Nocardia tenerifensis]|uniref:DNA-directed RNA polymerase specialized sigma24 family protein n=1 Tax=Nocardia tenerifensis TaxID=228006 RepID=A0A318JZA6_9NOCA|nr:sigma-70 family RNA polymerase sigma factor [Nocardia tenerifensis]PXX59801.1 hypothetical protein DFR70_111185 [Nocardia tenerifensis]
MASSDDAPTSGCGSSNSGPSQPCSGEQSDDVADLADAQQDLQLQVAAQVDYVLDATTVVETRECSSADGELFAALEEFGFTGPTWDLFATALIRQGAAALIAWSYTGWIFKVLRDNDVRLAPPPTQKERHRLATEDAHRADLIRPAVASALVKVQRELQEGTGWKTDGGMSLTTYFVGACVLAFGNEFRKHRRRDRFFAAGHADCKPDELADDGFGKFLCVTPFPDPEATAINNAVIRDALHGMSTLERTIIWAKASGYTAAEIAELHPETTKKAIEQRWARLKEKHEWVDRLTVTRRKS